MDLVDMEAKATGGDKRGWYIMMPVLNLLVGVREERGGGPRHCG